MNTEERFRQDLQIEFVKAYGPDTAADILGHMDSVLYKYEIKERETALVPAEATIKEICETYFAEMLVDGVKQSSAKNYCYTIREFLRMVARPLTQITANDVRNYIYVMQQKVKTTTLTCKERQIFRFFEWCVREEYLQKNPMLKIKIAKSRAEERKPLTRKESLLIKNACETPKEKALIQFLLSTGCRISEAANLKISDIDLRSGTISIRHAKFDKSRTVYIDDEFELIYEEYMNQRKSESDYFFVGMRTGTGVTTHALRETFEKVVARSGIKRKVTPHFTRHTFVTNMLRMGASPNKVAAIAGHESIDTTCRIYGHLSEEEIHDAYRRCHVA